MLSFIITFSGTIFFQPNVPAAGRRVEVGWEGEGRREKVVLNCEPTSQLFESRLHSVDFS